MADGFVSRADLLELLAELLPTINPRLMYRVEILPDEVHVWSYRDAGDGRPVVHEGSNGNEAQVPFDESVFEVG